MIYKVNETCTIEFDPLSQEFAERLATAFREMERIHKSSDINIFAKNEYLRAKIDGLFGEGTSDKIFGEHYLFLTAGGFPLWFNFMNTVIREVDQEITAEEAKERPRAKRKKSHKQ